jgi:hypothetical protein
MAEPFVLLVEGTSDAHVLLNLLQINFGSKEDEKVKRVPNKFRIEIRNIELVIKAKIGVLKLLDDLDEELDSSDLKTLGIVLDADAEVDSSALQADVLAPLKARWESIVNRLVGLGYSASLFPSVPNADGTIIEQASLPKVGIWLMPDNKSTGMIEDFLKPNPENDPRWILAQKCVEEARQYLANIPINKAKIYTWLAWQAKSGLPLGQAISNAFIKSDAPDTKVFADWIKKLFDLN